MSLFRGYMGHWVTKGLRVSMGHMGHVLRGSRETWRVTPPRYRARRFPVLRGERYGLLGAVKAIVNGVTSLIPPCCTLHYAWHVLCGSCAAECPYRQMGLEPYWVCEPDKRLHTIRREGWINVDYGYIPCPLHVRFRPGLMIDYRWFMAAYTSVEGGPGLEMER